MTYILKQLLQEEHIPKLSSNTPELSRKSMDSRKIRNAVFRIFKGGEGDSKELTEN